MTDDLTNESQTGADEAAVEALPAGPLLGGAMPEVSATAGRYFRNARYLIVTAAVVVGLWFAHDGWINWPAENAKIAQLEKQQDDARGRKDDAEADRLAGDLKKYSFHSDMDLFIQKVLAIVLPVLGLVYLVYTLYRSRGQVRLVEDVLYVPGHPPITVASITRIDDRAWDRKGVSRVYYQIGGKSEARVVLDDFVYNHKPIRTIHDRVIFLVSAEGPAESAGEQAIDTEPSAGAEATTESRPASDLDA
jgi:hypothetical protein